MNRIRKLGAILGVKGLLCIASLIVVASALVTYTATVSISPANQFTIGATTASWTVYINDLNETRFLPSSGIPAGSQEPTFNAANSSTYAFMVMTDPTRVCAVEIELTSPVNSSKFSNFKIMAKYWNGTAWIDDILYDAATGSTSKSHIDGLNSTDNGYVHIPTSSTRYYLITVEYSYDLVSDTTQIITTFQYTPLPQDSF